MLKFRTISQALTKYAVRLKNYSNENVHVRYKISKSGEAPDSGEWLYFDHLEEYNEEDPIMPNDIYHDGILVPNGYYLSWITEKGDTDRIVSSSKQITKDEDIEIAASGKTHNIVFRSRNTDPTDVPVGNISPNVTEINYYVKDDVYSNEGFGTKHSKTFSAFTTSNDISSAVTDKIAVNPGNAVKYKYTFDGNEYENVSYMIPLANSDTTTYINIPEHIAKFKYVTPSGHLAAQNEECTIYYYLSEESSGEEIPNTTHSFRYADDTIESYAYIAVPIPDSALLEYVAYNTNDRNICKQVRNGDKSSAKAKGTISGDATVIFTSYFDYANLHMRCFNGAINIPVDSMSRIECTYSSAGISPRSLDFRSDTTGDTDISYTRVPVGSTISTYLYDLTRTNSNNSPTYIIDEFTVSPEYANADFTKVYRYYEYGIQPINAESGNGFTIENGSYIEVQNRNGNILMHLNFDPNTSYDSHTTITFSCLEGCRVICHIHAIINYPMGGQLHAYLDDNFNITNDIASQLSFGGEPCDDTCIEDDCPDDGCECDDDRGCEEDDPDSCGEHGGCDEAHEDGGE